MNLYPWIYVSNFHPKKLKLLDALFVTVTDSKRDRNAEST